MLELGSSGSGRGVSSNGHPYRDPGPIPETRPAYAIASLVDRSGLLECTFMRLAPTAPPPKTSRLKGVTR
jgi:hypothetical protein